MKKMRIIVIIIAIALGCIVLTTTSAGGGKGLPNRAKIEEIKGDRGENGKGHRQDHRRGRIFRGLDLTEDQKHQMGEIKRLFREEVKELYTAHRENMMSVLTPTQQDTMRSRMERIKEFRENKGSWRREDLRRRRVDFPGREDDDVDGVAKSTTNKPVANQSKQTTWGKVKNLFE